MRRHALLFIVMAALSSAAGLAFQAGAAGPYKVLKTAKVGGEGGTDYIFADTVGRRLYITRGATQAQAATETRPAVAAFDKRLTIFDLDTLEPVGTIPGVHRPAPVGLWSAHRPQGLTFTHCFFPGRTLPTSVIFPSAGRSSAPAAAPCCDGR